MTRPVLLVMLAWLALPAAVRAEHDAPLSVLFLGNSYTRFNVLPQLVRRLGRGPDTQPRLRVEAHARAGYTLRMHWRSPEVRRAVRSGRYTHVVLQDHSLRPLDRAEEFTDYVTRFAQAAERAGTRTVLYETWPRRPGDRLYRTHATVHDPQQMLGRVGDAYRELAHALGASVAPVGLAFLQGLGAHPEIELYRADGTHPSWAGSFLAACVLYGTLTGEDPRVTEYHPWEVDAGTANALRQLAAEALSAPVPDVAAQ